jgi:hypothetical protein
VEAFVVAWEAAEIDGLVSLLSDDARFAMPPLPAWFDGIAAVRAFFSERVVETPWRLLPMTANGQLAFACYQSVDGGQTFPWGRSTCSPCAATASSTSPASSTRRCKILSA